MVELRPITEDNFIDTFNLKLGPGQDVFVSHPVRSLAQAYVYRNQCQPFGIYAEGKPVGYVMGSLSRTRLSEFTFTFHFHALEKEMATHSSVLAWRIPGTGEPGGLLSMGSHRVRHD